MRREWALSRVAERPKVTTRIVGFTDEEWEHVRLAAAALRDLRGDAGTLILPDRPELLLRLDDRGDHYELRLSSERELAETVSEEMAG